MFTPLLKIKLLIIPRLGKTDFDVSDRERERDRYRLDYIETSQDMSSIPPYSVLLLFLSETLNILSLSLLQSKQK